MKKLIAAVLLTIACAPGIAFAQMLEKADATRESNFLYEVKIIDEFIERFNDDPSSALRKEYKRAGKAFRFTRQELIKSLFEHSLRVSDSNEEKFIEQVSDPRQPQLLSFDDTAWYAEVLCGFTTIDHRKVELPLILQVNAAADSSVKWMIAGIGDSHVFRDKTAEEAGAAGRQKPGTKNFIPPSDYATNFLELHHILLSGMNAENYFVPELLATDKGKMFVQLIQSKKLIFSYTGTMKFYFFQIPGYMFTVERFVRATNHSGWLITRLSAATDEEKQVSKGQKLQRSL